MTPNQKEQFEAWWYNEGSAGPNGQDLETHTKNMCEIAWSNGIYKRSAQDKIRVAVSICGIGNVWESLNQFVKHVTNNYGCADDMKVESDGRGIYNEATGRYLTETELEEFVSWAERENA